MKISFNDDEVQKAIREMENPFEFENHCGACDNFDTDNCPFKGKVDCETEYSLPPFRCKDFID